MYIWCGGDAYKRYPLFILTVILFVSRSNPFSPCFSNYQFSQRKTVFDCMAANLQSRGFASFIKQFVSRVRSRDSTVIRRGVHVSTYDKNPDEDLTLSAVVPDNVIPPQTQQYWAPHPKTGVFSPAKDGQALADEDVVTNGGAYSVLEQKAFFRPLEDLDKPQHP